MQMDLWLRNLQFAGIFADEGISGTSVNRREHFLEMIGKCKAGEIDLIITKQVSRFARNVLDSLKKNRQSLIDSNSAAARQQEKENK